MAYEKFMNIKTYVVILLIGIVVINESGWATPLYAVYASNKCGACHNPGRSEVEVWKRRCTLDCQGCHVDPNGAGPRNQWGYYFENDSLAMWNIQTPIDPLQDESVYDLHYDGRTISRKTDQEYRQFPMNSEFSFRLRPLVKWLNFTYQGNFLGRIGEEKLSSHKTQVLEKFSFNIDALPFNLYTKVFRGEPVYGLRQPNHTRWIRQKVGLSPFATVDGVSFGGTPTVPFVHFSLMEGNHQDAEEDKQKGYSFHGGMRGVTLGWHLHSSYWSTESQKAKVNMYGAGGGLKVADFVLTAERNWRSVEEKELTAIEKGKFLSKAIRLHPSSVISDYVLAYEPFSGMMVSIVYEDLKDDTVASQRKSVVIDLHPIPYLQLEAWNRMESGSRNLADQLLVTHLYWDF